MSPSSSTPNDSDLARAQRELADKSTLVQTVRTELIRAQITVLELQDSILQKETDKADAVAILGQAELALEGKINYIFELDRVLNARITALQNDLAAAQQAHALDQKARDEIAQDLVRKLDHANRDLGAAHTLAGEYAREANETREKLAASIRHLAQSQDELKQALTQLSAAHAELIATQSRLKSADEARSALGAELAAIRDSFAWKLTAPLRALGRKS